MNNWYRNRCCICGKFCKWEADNSIPFGNSCDYEPPEPEYYCKSCVKKEKKYHKEIGWLPSNWMPAKWEFEVAIEIGMWRAGPIGGAWSGWHKINEELPKDYEWKTIVGWEQYTPQKELEL